MGHKWETGSMLRVWSQTLDSSSEKAARLAGIFQLRGKKTGMLETIAGVGGPAKVSNSRMTSTLYSLKTGKQQVITLTLSKWP